MNKVDKIAQEVEDALQTQIEHSGGFFPNKNGLVKFLNRRRDLKVRYHEDGECLILYKGDEREEIEHVDSEAFYLIKVISTKYKNWCELDKLEKAWFKLAMRVILKRRG